MPEPLRIETLPDRPVAVDAFGSHQRIADALARIINGEPGGKAIAVTGPWGSGKSTVINLMRANLAGMSGLGTNRESTLIFEFDAWAHEGDSLRRAFLESLGARLQEAGWISREPWEELKWRLSHKQDVSETVSRPVLTPWGIGLTISLLLVPLGYALIRILNSTESVWTQRSWYGVIACIAAPVIVAGLASLLAKRKIPEVTTLFGKRHQPPPSFADVFLEHRNTVAQSTTVRGPDPTSVEFQQAYSQLVTTGLTDRSRKLCIVVDNLDRLEPSEVVDVWATLRVFASNNTFANEECLARLWIVASFDRLSLQRRLKHPDGASDPIDGLLEKTFDLFFRIPEPPLLSWQNYFRQCVAGAFTSGLDPATVTDLEYIFDRLKSVDSPVTPRQIKKFVNRLGVSARQWGTTVPLTTQTAYILRFAESNDTISDLQASEFLPIAVESVLSREAREDMVRLHFMADPDKAAYLLWAGRIKSAVRAANPEALGDLVKREAFSIALRQCMVEDLAFGKVSTLAEYSRFLQHIQRDSPEVATDAAWRLLGAHCHENISWDRLSRAVTSGLGEIVQRTAGNVWRAIFASIARETQKKDVASERLRNLFWSVESLFQELHMPVAELPLPHDVYFCIDLAPADLIEVVGGTKWLEACMDGARLSYRYSRVFRIKRETVEKCTSFLVEACQEKRLPAGAAKVPPFLASLVGPRSELSSLRASVVARIRIQEVVWTEDFHELIGLAASITDGEEKPEVYLRWLGLIFRSDTREKFSNEAAAQVLVSILKLATRSGQSITLGDDEQKWLGGPADHLLRPLLRAVVRNTDSSASRTLEKVLRQSVNESLNHLRSLILQTAADEEWLWDWIDAEDLIDSTKEYLSLLGPDRFRKAAVNLRRWRTETAFSGRYNLSFQISRLAEAVRLDRLLDRPEVSSTRGAQDRSEDPVDSIDGESQLASCQPGQKSDAEDFVDGPNGFPDRASTETEDEDDIEADDSESDEPMDNSVRLRQSVWLQGDAGIKALLAEYVRHLTNEAAEAEVEDGLAEETVDQHEGALDDEERLNLELCFSLLGPSDAQELAAAFQELSSKPGRNFRTSARSAQKLTEILKLLVQSPHGALGMGEQANRPGL
jgi:hypothetical protein